MATIPKSVHYFATSLNTLLRLYDVRLTGGITVGGYDTDSGEPQHWIETKLDISDVDGHSEVALLEDTASESFTIE